MAKMSSEKIARSALRLGLINDRQFQELDRLLRGSAMSLDDFTQALVRRELLTSFQLSRLTHGEKTGYFYGDYKVMYLVGTGTFARVYRAEHRVTGQIVAVKVLRQRWCDQKDEVQQFHREGEVGMTLRHPNIVSILDVARDGDRHFLVMEFVEGRTLREFVKIRTRCAPEEALRLMMDVASGLDYAHHRSFQHRDLKLSNVLISSRGTAKLVDFGLAAHPGDDDDSQASANPRTVDYAELERATGVSRNDTRSDIYFVGCMLYHILAGKPPLVDTRDRTARRGRMRFQEITPLRKLVPTLSRSILSVVAKAMQLDPHQRYQTPKEMLIAMQTALNQLNDQSEADQSHEEDTVIEGGSPRAERIATPQRSVMIVEANSKMQDTFRQHLKSAGFRVLVLADPHRALSRFEDDPPPAQCVVFSTQDLGEDAVTSYEQFLTDPHTAEIPAVLLLGPKHSDWSSRSDGEDHHVVAQLPVTLGEFREVLDRLVPHATV